MLKALKKEEKKGMAATKPPDTKSFGFSPLQLYNAR
jgi:hypothetical protein